MSSRSQVFLFAALFILAGLGVTLYKHILLHIPLVPGSVRTVWDIEAKITFSASGEPVTVNLALPETQSGFEILDESFASSGYGFSIGGTSSQRRAIWTGRQANGDQTLYYKLQLTRRPALNPMRPEQVPEFDTNITKPEWTPVQYSAATGLIRRARELSSSPESFTVQLLKLLNDRSHSQDANLLFEAAPHASAADLAVKLLAEADVPAHMVRGIRLSRKQYNQKPTELIEIHNGSQWVPFNLATAREGLPEDFFMWQRGGQSLIDVLGAHRSRVRFSLLANVIPAKNVALMEAKDETAALIDFSIYSLPVEKQAIFKLLLLVPIGGLIVVIFRVLIGLRTSGTFMPVLIALAFIQTTLVTGIAILITLIIVGLWIRSYLSRMDMLMVSRITAVLIVVVMLMAAFSVLSYKLGLDQLLNITFFPMIILAWTIERMSITWEEDGAREVFIQGGGSLVVAVCAYLAMTNDLVEHLTYNFPEVLFVVLGIILLLGQYSGYRLSELRRFQFMER
ncbi:MAG: inactive transglutaminase family protein [Porticoccaceae bacterium]